jgi:hypothetical protein
MASLNSKLCWRSEAGECKGKRTSHVEFLRTPVNVVSIFSDQHHEASRRTAAEQMSFPLRNAIKFMLKKPIFTEPRILDPATLGNLVPIGNIQWDQVVNDF